MGRAKKLSIEDAEGPWSIMDGESTLAHQAFSVYLEMGPRNRTIEKVCNEVYGEHEPKMIEEEDGTVRPSKTRHKNFSSVAGWCTKFSWVARARAWDAHCKKVQRAQDLEERRNIARRQAKMAEQVGSALLLPAKVLKEREEEFMSHLKKLPMGLELFMSLERQLAQNAKELGRVLEAEREAAGILVESDEDEIEAPEPVLAFHSHILEELEELMLEGGEEGDRDDV